MKPLSTNSALCIAGAHRSGTSMVTQLLHRCGLDLGPQAELMPARSDNPEGFWENLHFVAINDEVLNELGGAWDLPPPPGADFEDARLDPQRTKARWNIAKFGSSAAWGWKDPRNCLTLRFWQQLLPKLKVLLVVRNPLEVAYSMQKRNRTSYSFGLRLWEIYNRSLIEGATADDLLVTHYDAFFEDSEKELERMVAFSGLPSSQVRIAASLVTKNKRHTTFSIEQLVNAQVAPELIELYQQLIAQSQEGPFARELEAHPSPELLPGTVSRLNVSVPGAEDVRQELAWLRGSEMTHREELARRDGRISTLQENVARQEVARSILERQLTLKDALLDQLTVDLRRQCEATKKLAWLLKETEEAAARLRSSRRWKLGNPFATLREIFGGRRLAGYGHLEKIVAEYSKWQSSHPEIKNIEELLQKLNRQLLPAATHSFRNNGSLTAPREPPAPTRPINFLVHETQEVSIVIPVFNQLRFTLACLASIQENQDDRHFEVIVVDDCSTDETRETLSRIPGLVYLSNEKNLGFVASCNRGASQARGKYLLFFNNDTLVTPGWLSSLLETFSFEPDAGLVGSKLVYPDGRLQEAGGIIWRDGSGWNRGKFDDARKPEYNFLCEVDYCSGACLMIAKSLFDHVGGFDMRYVPAYYEDTDLAFKVRAAGKKVFYQPLSQIIHYEGATGGTDVTTGAKKYQDVNRNTFVEKWSEVLSRKPVNGDVAALGKLAPGQKRILVIDHHLPMPDRDSGSVRMFQILLILHHLGHRVTFLPDNLGDIQPYAAELRRRGIEVVLCPPVKSAREFVEANGAKFDAVILSRWPTAAKHIASARLHAPASRIIFDTVDLHSLRAAREADLSRDTDQRVLAEDTRRQEYEVIYQADETWVVSEAERELLRQHLPDKQIEVVSNIVEVQKSAPPFSLRSDFLFIGSFLHPPNVDAVLFFAREIHPLVAQQLPEAKFYIIGHKAPAEVVELASENIIVTGGVSDVRPFFDTVRLSIAPLRFGAGVKGKINQSMGFGVPVVGTSIAVEGMSLTNREDILIADSPQDFARALIEVYESQELWERISRNGIEKTRAAYSIEVATEQLSRLLSDTHIHQSAMARFRKNLESKPAVADEIHDGAAR